MSIKYGLVGFLVLTLFFFVPVSANANAAGLDEEVSFEEDDSFSIFGGGGYTTFSDDELSNDIDMTSGYGFYGGAVYNFTKNLGVGGQYEYWNSSDSHTEEGVTVEGELTVSGPVGFARYNITPEEATNFYIKGGAGYYSGKLEAKSDIFSITVDLESAIGFNIGGGLEHEIQDGISIIGEVGYRILETNTDVDNDDTIVEEVDVDLSGLVISGGLGLSF